MQYNVKAFPKLNTPSDGMDLRDYFAAHALQGMFANPTLCTSGKFSADNFEVCYEIADMMMEIRDERTRSAD